MTDRNVFILMSHYYLQRLNKTYEVKFMKITEYHPFKSHEAREKYLKFYDKRAKNWPVPSETQVVNTSYGRTFVRVSGPIDAPPLVIVPGGGSSSLMWVPNIESLSKEYRTYALDNIYDWGLSVYSRPIKNPKDFVKWLNELFDALGLENNVNLMGLSYGGWITSQCAFYSPERLNKVVLLAPFATIQSMPLEFLLRMFTSLLPVDYTTKSLMYWLCEDSIKDKNKRMLVDEWVNDMLMGLKCFKFKLVPTPTVFKDEELKSIKVPALFLVGENEKVYSPQKAVRRLNNLAPHIETEILPNAGHDLTVAQADMVNEKVLEFLK